MKYTYHRRPIVVSVLPVQNPLATDLDCVLEFTADALTDLRGGRIFITGGTGFFGCWLVESLLWSNLKLNLDIQVHLLTRNVGRFRGKAGHLANDPNIHLHEGDVRTFAYPDGAFDCVIHAATESATGLNERKPQEMLDVIVDGTRRVLTFAADAGARNFLLTSSGAVYGGQPSDVTHISETFTGAPNQLQVASAYAEGKRMAELMTVLCHKERGLQTKIARGFAFVGPYLPIDAHFAIGNFIRDSLQGGDIQIGGDGTPHRSYLYSSDLIIWLLTILFKGQPSQAYNVGSEESLSIAEIAEAVSRQFSPAPKIRIARTADPATPVSRYVPSTQLAQKELGLTQRIPLSSAIAKTIAWHRAKLPATST